MQTMTGAEPFADGWLVQFDEQDVREIAASDPLAAEAEALWMAYREINRKEQ